MAGAIDGDSARATIAMVFRHSQYHRSLRRTLWQQILEWLSAAYHAIESVLRASPGTRWGLVAVLLAVAGLIVSRMSYARLARQGPRRLRPTYGVASGIRDQWAAAQSEANAGRYLEAAHALYLAVLESLSRSDRLSIDAAKTVGDYSRELRTSSSASLGYYRDFARAYEPVVWGSRTCDRECFEQLSLIATKLSKL